ncbi:MAG TPA: hypothetical protein VGM06_02245 [Polyangiaceae bacterium]
MRPLPALLIAALGASVFAGCNGADACGCLCDGPPDGSILAPCSSGVVDESDGATSTEPDARAE